MIRINTAFYRRRITALSVYVLSLLTITSTSCGVKEVVEKKKEMDSAAITYSSKIRPMLQVHCTPCHFPDQGHEKLLHEYDAVKASIDEILYRTQLDPSEQKYMPYLQKRIGLSTEQIRTLQEWKAQDFPQ